MDTVWLWGVDVIVWIQQFRTPALDAVMRVFTFLGEEQFYLLLLPFLLWCVDFKIGARVSQIYLLSVVVNGVLKESLMQPRPFDFNPAIKLIDQTGYGLPSGHAQSALVVWGSLATWARQRWVWILAVVVIVLVSTSRIYLGVHFPTDVLAGWAVGIVLLGAYSVALPLAQRTTQRFSLSVHLLGAVLGPGILAWVYPLKDNISAMGTLAGIGVGLIAAQRAVAFTAAGPWWQRGIRFVVGATILLALYTGLAAVFPRELSVLYPYFRFLRYGLLGLWATWGGPWLFLRLRLGQTRSSPVPRP